MPPSVIVDDSQLVYLSLSSDGGLHVVPVARAGVRGATRGPFERRVRATKRRETGMAERRLDPASVAESESTKKPTGGASVLDSSGFHPESSGARPRPL